MNDISIESQRSEEDQILVSSSKSADNIESRKKSRSDSGTREKRSDSFIIGAGHAFFVAGNKKEKNSAEKKIGDISGFGEMNLSYNNID